MKSSNRKNYFTIKQKCVPPNFQNTGSYLVKHWWNRLIFKLNSLNILIVVFELLCNELVRHLFN